MSPALGRSREDGFREQVRRVVDRPCSDILIATHYRDIGDTALYRDIGDTASTAAAGGHWRLVRFDEHVSCQGGRPSRRHLDIGLYGDIGRPVLYEDIGSTVPTTIQASH